MLSYFYGDLCVGKLPGARNKNPDFGLTCSLGGYPILKIWPRALAFWRDWSAEASLAKRAGSHSGRRNVFRESGRVGGLSMSDAKVAAVRAGGKKGGRPVVKGLCSRGQ